MIPRYEPTYSFGELSRSFNRAFQVNRTDELETLLQEYYQVRNAFVLKGGRASLYGILRALNKPGKVLMPAYTCRSVPESAVAAGYTPYFLDPNLQTMNVLPELYEKAMTEEVSAIFVCSLFGIPYDVRPLVEAAHKKGILLVEDAATAMGGRIGGKLVGTLGDAAIISFQDTKVLSAKTGGAIITNNDLLAEKIRTTLKEVRTPAKTWSLFGSSLFQKISTRHWLYPLTQFVYRVMLGEAAYEVVQAPTTIPEDYLTRCAPFSVELVLNQWKKLEQNISRRNWIGKEYTKALEGNPAFQIPSFPPDVEPVWIQFPMLVKNKSEFYKYMQRQGVDITWSHRYSCAQEFPQEDCPNSIKIARSILSLPCYPGLRDSEVEKICRVASEYVPGSV